jgi:molybdopterin/thiamine biosynthesis adenylyltransferase
MTSNMQTEKVSKNLWGEFFLDKNVRFPEFPLLIEGISIYDAPYGLGVQFRGGPNKLVIRGAKSSEIFLFIKDFLDGKHSLADVFDLTDGKYELDDVASMMKILHAHNLLTNKDTEADAVTAKDIVALQQLQYFNRIIGRTGYNKTGLQIINTIAGSKVLVISSANLAGVVLANLQLAGFKHIGLCYSIKEKYNNELGFSRYTSETLMAEVNITDLAEGDMLNELSKRIDDYQQVIIAFENPSRKFMEIFNTFCINRNKPVLFFSVNINTYEIGPYVIPKACACYTCSILRKNSGMTNAVYDSIYHDGLSDKLQNTDDTINGFDILSANVAIGLMVSEFSKLISGSTQPTLINKMIEYDFLNGSINNLMIPKVPGCPGCTV